MKIREGILVAVAILLMAGGFVLAWQNNVAGAGTTYVGAIFCLVFAFLSQFKKFSGLGFTGETWEQKMREADELIVRLKNLAVVVTEPILMLIPRMGRWDSHLTRMEQYELVKRIEAELATLGVSASDIDKAKADIHAYIIRDLAGIVVEGAYKVAHEKTEQVASAMNSMPQPIIDHQQYAQAVEAWREACAAEQTIRAARTVTPPEAIPGALRAAIAECVLLTQDQRHSILKQYQEEIADLEHYAKNHSLRRPSVWLAETELP